MRRAARRSLAGAVLHSTSRGKEAGSPLCGSVDRVLNGMEDIG